MANKNRPFPFQKRVQLFVGSNDQPLTVATRIDNPDRSPFKICHSASKLLQGARL